MSDPQRDGEQNRRDRAAERRAERDAALDGGAVAPHSLQPLPRRTLMLAAAGLLAAVGMVTSLLFGPWAALVFFLPAVALGGYGWRQPGVERPAGRSLASDPVTRAYEDARRVVDQSPRLAIERRVELLAVIDGSYEQARRWRDSRPELERAASELEGSDTPEGATVRKALSDLGAYETDFVRQCDVLRRTVTSLDIQGGPGAPEGEEELAAATDELRAEVAAETELTQALRAARSPVGRERA